MNDYWTAGNKPFHIDVYFATEEARQLYRLADECDLRSCLDIGCGLPTRGKRILNGFKFLDSVDHHPINASVQQGDVCTWSGGPYTTILCSRVLCNLPAEQREKAIKNLSNLLVEGGRLLLADSSEDTRERVQAHRCARGWTPLPDSSSGSTGLTPADFMLLYKAGFQCIKQAYPAADYMIWTRRDQEPLLPEEDPRRYTYPRYTEDERQRYSWPRIWLLRRTV